MYKLVIVGAGVMGRQVALWAAGCGFRVTLIDPDHQALTNAQEFFKLMHVRFPVLTEHASMLARIQLLCATLDSDVCRQVNASADMIWEFGPEDLKTKRVMLNHIANAARPDALLASGTSAIKAAELFRICSGNTRCVKIHPFALLPVALPMVEVVAGPSTSTETLDRTWEMLAKLRLVPFQIENDPIGQGMNRLWELIKEEVIVALAAENYTAAEIDAMFRIFTGMFAGPTALIDMVGTTTVSAIMQYYYQHEAGLGHPVPKQFLQLAEQNGKLNTAQDRWRRGTLEMRSGKTTRNFPLMLPDQLAGEWTLVEMLAIDPDGNELYRPLGRQASGLLRYSRFGTMAVDLERDASEPQDPRMPAELATLLAPGFVFYRGRFWTEPNATIVHQTEVGFPAMMSKQTLTRYWSFTETGELVLDTPPGQYGDPTTRVRLVWKFRSPN